MRIENQTYLIRINSASCFLYNTYVLWYSFYLLTYLQGIYTHELIVQKIGPHS